MQEFREEFTAYERLGGEIEENFTIIHSDDYDPTQRFYMFVSIIIKSLTDMNVISLDKQQRKDLLTRIRLMRDAKYKNPTGIVLGYYVTQGGQRLSTNKLASIIPHLDSLDYPINSTDVIRYSRLWLSESDNLK